MTGQDNRDTQAVPIETVLPREAHDTVSALGNSQEETFSFDKAPGCEVPAAVRRFTRGACTVGCDVQITLKIDTGILQKISAHNWFNVIYKMSVCKPAVLLVGYLVLTIMIFIVMQYTE